MRLRLLAACLLSSSIAVFPQVANAQSDDPPSPSEIVILDVEGHIDYAHEGWTAPQPLQAGAYISTEDFIYPQSAHLTVLCPDGSPRQFLPSELLSNDVIRCPLVPDAYIVGQGAMQSLSVQRGGRQDPSIPYVLSPRSTLLRSAETKLVWNAPPDVAYFTVTVWEAGEPVWTSDRLTRESVAVGAVASLDLPIQLRERTPYTVQICAVFIDFHHGCTTDPAWAAAVNLAFYYHPNSTLDKRLNVTRESLGDNSPASLYAQAMLLAQPQEEMNGVPIAYYGEAIRLLERVLTEHANSALARGPYLPIRLGDYYRSVNLPLSASRAYRRALELAAPGTQVSAIAATGSGKMTSSRAQARQFFERALEDYAQFLTGAEYDAQFEGICKLVGEVCLDLAQCEENIDLCMEWYRESIP